MKTSLFLLFALSVLVAVVAVPSNPGPTPAGSGGPPALIPIGSGHACRLEVEVGPRTVVDRGTLAGRELGTLEVGAFRYWEEPTGPVLYVYDDVQNLQARIRNPQSVRVLEAN